MQWPTRETTQQLRFCDRERAASAFGQRVLLTQTPNCPLPRWRFRVGKELTKRLENDDTFAEKAPVKTLCCIGRLRSTNKYTALSDACKSYEFIG